MSRRRYSDRERAQALAALDANGGDVTRTSRDTCIPRQTLQEWAAGKVPNDVPEFRHAERGDLADRMEAIAWSLADALPGKIESAGLKEVATSMGIAIDKMRLLRGESTSIHERQTKVEGRRTRLLAIVGYTTGTGGGDGPAALPTGGAIPDQPAAVAGGSGDAA